MRNKTAFVISISSMIFALLLATNGNVWATTESEGCGYDDPNPDSFEVDQLCDELDNDPTCFTNEGELVKRCAEKLEAQGSQEYEAFKKYRASLQNCTK